MFFILYVDGNAPILMTISIEGTMNRWMDIICLYISKEGEARESD